VANAFIEADQIVMAAQLLLQREIVLPRLVFTPPANNYVGALDDTITLRVPAVLASRTRTMRSNTALTADDLTETKVPVALTDHVYQLLNIRDEELTLDIVEFSTQVLAPQMRAVAEGLENVIADALQAADAYASTVTLGSSDHPGYDAIVDAGAQLNILNVPRAGRVLLVGANVEAFLLKEDIVAKANESGTTDALREATLTRLAGFTIVGSNAIDPDAAFAFDRFAVALGAVAPALPDGAAMKARVSESGIGMRFLRDYNPTNSTGPVDRSLVDIFAGAASVDQAPPDNPAGAKKNRRLVKVDFGLGWAPGS
jgi:hypothetical protein